MEIIVGKLSGFCSGVEYTIKKAEEILSKNDTVYCLGEIVHNEFVIEKLEKNGMITVTNIEEIPDKSKVIFRAHGEAPQIYEKAKEKNLEVYDLTCGKIRLIHKSVEKENKKSYIIIIGKKKHPEITGTKGFSGNNCSIIENDKDINEAYEQFKKSKLNQVYVVSQTTFSNKKFNEITNQLKGIFINVKLVINNTICDATEKRQLEVEDISKNVDKVLIVGGKNSSNTKELAEIALKNCKNTYLIQSKDDILPIDFKNSDRIGIMGGASTPKETIENIINAIKNQINHDCKASWNYV